MAYSLESGDMLCLMEGHSAAVLGAVITRKGRCAVFSFSKLCFQLDTPVM